MTSNLPRYTLRIPKEILDKIHYISAENGRSTNKEIEFILKKVIAEYEKKNGTIKI